MNGRTLDGKYRLIRRVGAGAMGAVHVAERIDGGGMVAIKLINSREHASNPSVVERFYREAQAAGRIDSPHITRVLDAGTDPESGAPYMAMELLQGQDLHRFSKRVGPLDPELMLRISAQVCCGLVKAHEASVIHRDIKPANLFLTRMDDGTITVKVLDFGIAKLTHVGGLFEGEGGEDMDLTRTGMLLGSPLFMSPEQTRGTKYIDHRSDLWSLGTVMFRMLAGRTPYEHIRAVGELIFAICSAPPPSVQNLAPWVPPEVAAVIERVLRVDPDDRCQSAAELLAAIRAVLGSDETITEGMLVGISAERRAQVAPRLDGGEPMAVPESPPPAARSSAEPQSTSPGAITTGSRGSASIADVPGPGWISGPGLQKLPGVPAAASAGEGPASSRGDPSAITRPSGPAPLRSSGTASAPLNGPASVRSSGPASVRSSGPASVRSGGPVSWRSSGPVSAPSNGPASTRSSGPVSASLNGPASTRSSGPVSASLNGPVSASLNGPVSVRSSGLVSASLSGPASARSSGPASFPTGSDPFQHQGFPGNRSTVASEQGMSNSASMLDIPAFRPSRTPMLVAGGVIAALIAVVLVQLTADDSTDQVDSGTAAVIPSSPADGTPTPGKSAAQGPAAGASPAASGSGVPASSPLRDPRKSGGPSAVYRGPTPGIPRPTPPNGAPPAPSPATHATPGNAPAPLDPNGFGDRK